jgi:hypothetical protein
LLVKDNRRDAVTQSCFPCVSASLRLKNYKNQNATH